MNNQNISNWCHFLLRLFGKRKRRKEREAQVEERGKKWRLSLVLSRSFLFCALPHTRLAFNWAGLKNATNCRLSSFISLLLSLMLFSRSPCACISSTENMKVASVHSTLKMLYSRARWCFNLKKAYLKTNSHTSFKCPMFYIQLSKWTLNEASIEAVWQQQATSKQEPFYFGEAWKV